MIQLGKYQITLNFYEVASYLAYPERGEMRGGMEIGEQGAESSEVKGECAMRARCWTDDGTTDWHDGMASVRKSSDGTHYRKRGEEGVTAEIGEEEGRGQRRGALETLNFDD